MKVCTALQMRKIDKTAEELGGIPGIVLMENAAIACVQELERMQLSGKRVGIFCGRGNNGGDGFAIARHLINRGWTVTVYLVCGTGFSGDALMNYEILSKMGAKITEIFDADFLEYAIGMQDIVVDAIFGTDIHGEIEGIAADVIDGINRWAKQVLSVDIPSGINADTGEVCGCGVQADVTVTFAAYKMGMLLFPGAEYVGKIVVADISIPEYIINEQGIRRHIIDAGLVQKLLPRRRENTQKGDYGKLLIVGGAEGMAGAVTMAAQAALKSGCGLVTVAVPQSLYPIVATKLTEAMTLPLPAEGGYFSEDAAGRILQKMQDMDALLIGPGIGRCAAVGRMLAKVLANAKIPVILDADALYAVAQNPAMLDACGCNLIFTPHAMEMARLLGVDVQSVEENRPAMAEQFAQDKGITLVLKGKHTIVTAPDGTQYYNMTGNSGMASGGSGDVLAGMIGAFLARGMDEPEAALLAVYLHGRAGDIAAVKHGKESMTACNIIENIADALILPVDSE